MLNSAATMDSTSGDAVMLLYICSMMQGMVIVFTKTRHVEETAVTLKRP